MNPLSISMQEAWLQRAARAESAIVHALQAPALFKPEAVRQPGVDYKRAMHFAKVWA